jgi:putative serine protease PepD
MGMDGALRRGAGYLLGPALLALVLSACSTTASPSASTSSTSTTSGATAPANSSAAAALQQTFIDVVNKVRPSVVQITTGSELGSGVVYDTKGDIVTNAHVVSSAQRFTVTLADGKNESASLVGSFTPDDLAMIRVASPSGLVPATFADSSKLAVGEIVMAVGNPLGLQSSVTNGIISAVGRTVSEPNNVTLPGTVQTSAPINPGNSGGALVDLDGAVVGIPTLAATDPQLGGSAPGIGFAIPSNTVKRIGDQLASQGKVTSSGRAALGITGAATGYDQSGRAVGVIVGSVVQGGPAAGAGIQPGDVIVSVAGTKTPTIQSLTDALANLSPGQQVKVGVLHQDGSQSSVQVTLGELSGG